MQNSPRGDLVHGRILVRAIQLLPCEGSAVVSSCRKLARSPVEVADVAGWFVHIVPGVSHLDELEPWKAVMVLTRPPKHNVSGRRPSV